MMCPSFIDVLDAAKERLGTEFYCESHDLPFDAATGLLVLLWLAALAGRMVTEERRADA